MNWKDNFSQQAAAYAQYRPQYPPALYQFLQRIIKRHQLAWDCGTGNGQVATQLAIFFDKVIATDASASQLAVAQSVPHLEYRLARAEDSGLSSHSVDLITVAQAIHWFDIEAFYREIYRVAHDEAIVAIWGYGLLTVSPAVDEIIRELYTNTLGHYWDPARKHLDAAYQNIPFPFQVIPTPRFKMQLLWSLPELIGYLNTWSSVQKFIMVNNSNPITQIEPFLQRVWDKHSILKPIVWDIYLQVGKVFAA
ncbi:SAM (and some other nucleotide) binding motif [Thioploca ingrica]|uniref:SAM (And some other nucleotide) binding motif n=1 Tax=Thioploca ingrica TaxID=40754 RepID=A0A090BU99_9GAMM|nr:SAM (and some other nucleotide) binding motif [Thioploca ingrica]